MVFPRQDPQKEAPLELMVRLNLLRDGSQSLRDLLLSSYGYYHSLQVAPGVTMSDESLRSSNASLLGVLEQLSTLTTTAEALLRLWDDALPSG